jgi:RNA polymerase sigma factor (sigma-70 family)
MQLPTTLSATLSAALPGGSLPGQDPAALGAGGRHRMERVDRDSLQRQLVELAEGNRDAFQPVFVRLWPLLRGFAARCLPREEAEDAAQEALLRIFSRAAEFDRQRQALPWVLGIAAYEIRSARRRRFRRREEPVDGSDEQAAADRSPEDSALASGLERELAAALATLPPGDVATLLAYARDERPDLPAATFRKRLERALARLRDAWRLNHDRP